MSVATGVRKRGKSWSYVVELGAQPVQRCDCGFRAWVERKPLEACTKCGGELQQMTEHRQREVGGFRTQAAAKGARADCLHSLGHGVDIKPAKTTLKDYLNEKWLPGVKRNVRPSTYLTCKIHVERHITPDIGHVALQNLTSEMLDDFYELLLTEPRAAVEQPAKRKAEPGDKTSAAGEPKKKEEPEPKPPLSWLTVRHIHATIHKALEDAVRSKKLTQNPAEYSNPPKMESIARH